MCTPKAITLHGTTLFRLLTTEMHWAVWAVGLSIEEHKKNPEALENALTLDPCHDPRFNAITTKMILDGPMEDITNLNNFGVNPLIGVRSLGT